MRITSALGPRFPIAVRPKKWSKIHVSNAETIVPKGNIKGLPLPLSKILLVKVAQVYK